MALAATLAVAQQGTRPSDVDVLRVWAPKIPDPYRDTAESQAQKWRLIDIELQQTGGPGGIDPKVKEELLRKIEQIRGAR